MIILFSIDLEQPNGLRYLRWGGDGEAVQPEKGYGVGNCLGCAQNPQRQVVSLREDTADRCQVGRQVRPSCSRIAVSVSQVIPNSCKVTKTVY